MKVTSVPMQRSEYPMIDMLVWRLDDSAKRKKKTDQRLKCMSRVKKMSSGDRRFYQAKNCYF